MARSKQPFFFSDLLRSSQDWAFAHGKRLPPIPPGQALLRATAERPAMGCVAKAHPEGWTLAQNHMVAAPMKKPRMGGVFGLVDKPIYSLRWQGPVPVAVEPNYLISKCARSWS